MNKNPLEKIAPEPPYSAEAVESLRLAVEYAKTADSLPWVTNREEVLRKIDLALAHAENAAEILAMRRFQLALQVPYVSPYKQTNKKTK